MPQFKKYKLEDVVDIIMGQSPEGATCNKNNKGVPLLNGPTEFGDKFPTAVQYTTDPKKFSEVGDILFCVRGSTTGRMNFSDRRYAIGRGLAAIRHKKGKHLQSFVKGLIDTILPGMLQNVTGSTFPNLSKEQLNNYEVEIPEDLPTQTRIASILSSLDDKIELNRRTNHTLEQMAQTLFKKYFVDDIDPENLPEGWTKMPIGEIINYAIGGDWGKEVQDELHTIKVTIIRGTDFTSVKTGNFTTAPVRFIKEANFSKRKLIDGDILLEISGGSTDQPTGRNFRMSEQILNSLSGQVVPASFCRLIRPVNRNIGYYLFLYLQILYDEGGTWEYQNQSTGISNFQFTYFTENEIICIPIDEKRFDEFAKHVEPILDKIDKNILEINVLTKVRDSLLPKLMSGEIEVNIAEKELVN